MSSRRWLIAVTVLSATLHVVGMARSPLPAQDGLKFLRFARDFQVRPWADVVRSSDQHPLYSALIAVTEPVVAVFLGHGPAAWRVAAQGVSALAALALLWPLHAMARRLFDDRAADLAVLLYALLPVPAAVGHDTLSDSLALSLTVASLCLGERMMRTKSWLAAIGCGAMAGLGYLARPEVALVPPVVVIASLLRRRTGREELAMAGRLAALAVSVLAFVGGYAAVKGGDFREALAPLVDVDRRRCTRGEQGEEVAEGARQRPVRLLAQGGGRRHRPAPSPDGRRETPRRRVCRGAGLLSDPGRLARPVSGEGRARGRTGGGWRCSTWSPSRRSRSGMPRRSATCRGGMPSA